MFRQHFDHLLCRFNEHNLIVCFSDDGSLRRWLHRVLIQNQLMVEHNRLVYFGVVEMDPDSDRKLAPSRLIDLEWWLG